MKLIIEIDLDDTCFSKGRVLKEALRDLISSFDQVPDHGDVRSVFHDVDADNSNVFFAEVMTQDRTACEARAMLSRAPFDRKLYAVDQTERALGMHATVKERVYR